MSITAKIASFLGGKFGESVVGYFKKKQELKHQLKLARMEGEIEVEKAKNARIVKAMENDQEWEIAQIRNSGWKDEWVLILLSIPLVLVFIPHTAPFVLAGFNVLGATPDWYQWLIMLIFTAIYGIRIWRRKM